MGQRILFFKRLLAGAMAGVMLAGTVGTQLPASVADAAPASQAVGEISVNPQVHYQTLKGWGTSMCWWGNVIGSWGDKDFNNNGRSDREEIAELAFSPEYLNLNIVRYNVGGGDKEDSSIKRVEGLVPGWTKDMTGKADGTGTFNAADFYAKKTEEMSDAGQLWMLEQANRWRKDTATKNGTENDIINEVFSNSPPYYMTKSGSSTGGVNAASNLKEDCYDDFALYMARAAKWIENDLSTKFGSHVNYIEPMNEPDTNYWSNGSAKQEGCVFKPGAEQSKMLLEMQKALNAQEFNGGLDNVALTGTDETDLARAISSFESLTAEAKNSIAAIGAHTYSGNDSERNTLRKLSASYDKELWMSEITKGNYDTHSHDSMLGTNAKSQSEGIMADLKYMQPSAWVAWLVADSEYECLQRDESWGLIHCVFESDGPVPDYHTNLVNSNGSKKKNVPDEGYWQVTKQLYTMMQYSKYLKAGYTMIDIGDSNMCAAISPDGKELVIVAQNFTKARNTSVDLSLFQNIGDVKLFRTSDTENCKEITGVSVADHVLDVALPANSVSTFVIQAETNADNYKQIIEADVETPSVDGLEASDVNKFSYTGTWSGQTTTDMSAEAIFKFQGKRAALYAAKGPKSTIVNVSVDGGAPTKVSLSDKNEIPEALVCDTGELAEGVHTIKVSVDASVTADNGNMKGTSLSLSHAELIHGTVSLASNAVIRKVEADDGALWITFDKSGSGVYTVRYGTSENNLDQSIIVGKTTAKIPGLTNGQTYYIQVEDSEGNASNIVTGSPKIPEGSLLYSVDVGTSKPDAISEDNKVGIYNSVLEQQYGKDPKTDKMWGYIEGEKGTDTETKAYWEEYDRLMSVRECKAGLEYKFELPAGSYNVKVAMRDPWPGGRFTDIVINGETVDTGLICTNENEIVANTYRASMKEAGEMSVKAVRSSNNASEAPILTYIEISKFDAQDTTITGIEEPPMLNTISGVIPHLPATVNAKTANDERVPIEVAWEAVTEDKFVGEDFTKATVKGSAVTEDGEQFEVNQAVQIMPENVQYFIDCNWAESTQHAALHAAVGLKNEVADKAYAEGSWGYLMSASGHSGSDSYTSGWYDPQDDKIQYKLPLEAGEYAITFGFHDWWNYMSHRPMNLRAYVGDKTVDLGTCGGSDANRFAITKDLAVSAKADVILSVERGKEDAPVLSWISIQGKGVDRSALKAQLNAAGLLNAADYSAQTYTKVSEAAEAGMALLLRSDATQDGVNQAAAAIQAAIEVLDVSAESRDSLQEELNTVSTMDLGKYTQESAAAMTAVVQKMTTLLAKDKISKTELNAVMKELEEAKRGLEMKQESRPADDLRIELNAWIYRAENLNSILYTGESWSSLQTKVAGAKTVYDNQAATSKALADAISDIQTAIADLQKASGSGHDGDNEVGNYHVAVSKSILEKNKYVLYTVNCGTPDPFEVPGGEVMGLLQSKVDQEYGADKKTGAVWGCAPADEHSAAVKGGSDAEDSGLSYIYMSDKVAYDKEKSGLRYTFETLAPSDSYEGILKTSYDVTVSFKNPWSSRTVNISLEGKTVEERLTLPRNVWVSKTYRVVVTDGELNVMISNPNRININQDPLVNAITVKAVAGTPDVSKLQSSVNKAKLLSKNDYTASTWKSFETVYNQAKSLLTNPGNDQNVVDVCQSKLELAMAGLVKAVKVSRITLSSDVKKLAKGRKFTLKAAVTPANAANKSLIWTSSNEKVAAVSSGVVTGKGSGKATITATAADGSGVKGTYAVTVVSHAVKKISLKSGTTGLAAGKKLTVANTITTTGKTANKTLAWSSSNKKYATVDSKGKVTAKAAGAGKKVTVTAKATDGSGVSGKTTIKIVKHAVKKITLKYRNKTIKSGKKISVKAGKKATIKASVKTTGKNANKKLNWTTSNKKFATVKNGKVTTKKAGKGKTVTITVKATDGSGKKATVKIKITK